MGTIYSTVLVTAPVAFLLGWLMAKVLFRHLSVVRPAAAPSLASHGGRGTSPAEAGDTDQFAGTDAPEQTAAAAETDALRNEIRLLRAGVAEGEQRIVELRDQLAHQAQPPEATTAAATDTELRAALGKQQSRVASRDKRIEELGADLEDARQRTARLADIFRRWRRRTRPLARQYRQQRLIIRELREELRQRDLAEQPTAPTPAAASSVPQIANSDLQSLHGVGPALQQRLQARGIYNLTQFVDMPRAELRELQSELGVGERRAAKYDWIAQARANLGLPPGSVAAERPKSESTA